MKKDLSASILCIGTELTSGQITNKNASWISLQLRRRGLVIDSHVVVPDERQLILEALRFSSHSSSLLFVTGGLGPTTDDFTRDLIAEWSGKPLEFDEASWQSVVEKLTARKFPVRDFQKQQCFFPQGSRILKNDLGTAAGFYLEAHGKKVFVLPGPPAEIEGIWNSAIDPWLEKETAHLDHWITQSWDTLGQGESEISFLTEKALAGSELEIGYRVHLPYVEVKISFLQSRQASIQKYISNLESTLKDFIITRNGEDLAESFCQKLKQKKSALFIFDEITEGLFLSRLQPYWKHLLPSQSLNYSGRPLADIATNDFYLAFKAQDEFHMNLEIRHQGQVIQKTFDSPYRLASLSERRKKYWVELALIEALKVC